MSDRQRQVKGFVALAAVLASLTTVAWRQSTARETMQELEDAAVELAVAVEEREALARQLAEIEKRSWIGEEAAARLDMRVPSEQELVMTSGDAR